MKSQEIFAMAETQRKEKDWTGYCTTLKDVFFHSVKKQAIRHNYSIFDDFQNIEDMKSDIYLWTLDFKDHIDTKGISIKHEDTTLKFKSVYNVPFKPEYSKALYFRVVSYVWYKVKKGYSNNTIEVSLYSDNTSTGLLESVESLESDFTSMLSVETLSTLEVVLSTSQLKTLYNIFDGIKGDTRSIRKIREKLSEDTTLTKEDIAQLYRYYVTLSTVEKNLKRSAPTLLKKSTIKAPIKSKSLFTFTATNFKGTRTIAPEYIRDYPTSIKQAPIESTLKHDIKLASQDYKPTPTPIKDFLQELKDLIHTNDNYNFYWL